MKSLGTMVLAGLLGIGLGLATSQLVPSADRHAPPSSLEALKNRQAPDFTLPGAQTPDPVTLAAYQGQVVLLNFFETGCPHCHEEIPALVKLHRDLQADGVAVIGVALDPVGSKEITRIAEELGVSYPLAIGNEGVAARYGGIEGVPTSFLIDRKGRVVEVFSGAVGYETLEKAVRSVK